MFAFRPGNVLAPRDLLLWRRRLWRSQRWPEERLRALQGRLLARLAEHCACQVPFYREAFSGLGLRPADIRTVSDLSRLPVLDKETVRARPDAFRPEHHGLRRAQRALTSGTTGTPLELFWDVRVQVMELLCQWRHFSWFGYRLGDAFLDLRNVRSHLKGADVRWNPACRGLESSIHGWEGRADAFAAVLRRYKVSFWRGHPDALYRMAGLLEAAGVRDVKPRFLITVGEMLWPEQRAFLEDWAGAPVAVNYGLNEHTALICECPQGGLHVASEYGLVEILKDDGTPAGEGEEGRLVASGLHNRAFPLLRYDAGDRAVASTRACSCGRTLPLVERIAGRSNEKLWDGRGRSFLGLQFVVKFAAGVGRVQIVQAAAGKIDVHYVPKPGAGPEAGDELIRLLRAELGNDMGIRLHAGTSVPHQVGGKHPFIVSTVKTTPDS